MAKKINTFRIELETLLASLAEFRQNNTLSTVLPSGALGQKEPGQVRITIVQGQVANCQIEYKDGRSSIVRNISVLYGLGPLEWQLDTAAAPLPSTRGITGATQTVNIALMVPTMAVYVKPEALNALSRSHRRVLMLIDGTRNVEKIATILFPSSQDTRAVLGLLRDLEGMGVIKLNA